MANLGIFRAYEVVLRQQASRYKCLEELFGIPNIYILSEKYFRTQKNISSCFLKYIGNMHPIQCVQLDRNNIEKFLNNDIKKFSVIMGQGEYHPLVMLVNKYAKKHGITTIDVHQSNDYYDRYFNLTAAKRTISYIDLAAKTLNSNFRSLLALLLKTDPKLLNVVLKNYNKAGFRFYKNLPAEYRFDRCYVYGNRSKEIYKQIGYDEKDVVVIGSADLSEYEKNKNNLEKYTQDKKYIIYIDSQYIDQFNFIDRFNIFAKSVIKHGYDLMFYPHPNLSDEFVNLLDNKITVLPKGSINKYIDNADFLFVHQSNMIDLLAYAKKRFCLLYDKNIVDTQWFTKQQAYANELGIPNINIENTEQIKQTLENFRIDEAKFDQYLTKECGDYSIHKTGRDNILTNDLKKHLNSQGVNLNEVEIKISKTP